MFKKKPSEGSTIATVQWTTLGGSVVTLGQLDHEYISNIYWMLRIGQDMKYNTRKLPTAGEIAFVTSLYTFIMEKFGDVSAYLPRGAEEASALKKGNYIKGNNNIFLCGQSVGNLSKLGYAMGPKEAKVTKLIPSVTLPMGLTTDYARFTLHPKNRRIVRQKVEDLVASLRISNNLAHTPITVDGQGQIVDGQHLFLAAQTLGLAIRVVLAGKLETTGGTSTNTASMKYLEGAGINLPGMSRKIGAAAVSKIEATRQPVSQEVIAQSNANVDQHFGLVIVPEPVNAAINNLLNKAGLTGGNGKLVQQVVPKFVASTDPIASYMEEVLESRAVMTWSALKLHLNIGDREPMNSEGLDIVRRAIQVTHQQATT